MCETPSQVHKGVLVSGIAHFGVISKGMMQLGLSSSHVLFSRSEITRDNFKSLLKASLGACVHFLEVVSTLSYCKGDSPHQFWNFLFALEPEIPLCKHIFVEIRPVWRWREIAIPQTEQEFSGLQRESFLLVPIPHLHQLFQQPVQAQRVGRGAERGELPPSAAGFPVSSWNWWNSSQQTPCGVCHTLKYFKITHKFGICVQGGCGSLKMGSFHLKCTKSVWNKIKSYHYSPAAWIKDCLNQFQPAPSVIDHKSALWFLWTATDLIFFNF